MPFKSFAFAVTAASQRELFFQAAPVAPRQQAFLMRAQPSVVMWAGNPEPMQQGWVEPKYEGWTEPPHPEWIEHPYPSGSMRGDRNTAPAPVGAVSARAQKNGFGAVAAAAVSGAADPEAVFEGWTEPAYAGWTEPPHPDWIEHPYPSGSMRGDYDTAGSDVAMLAVAGAFVGAVLGYKTKEQVSTLAVSGKAATLTDKIRSTLFAGLISVGLMSTPVVANAVDVKLGSDGGQLVFVPDEVKIKAGDSVTWVGNKGMPHNVVFDEENVPDGTNLDTINHEDMVNEEGEKVTSKFEKAGTYGYYCEPHRGAGMNGTVIVQ
jgi:plastocyanin